MAISYKQLSMIVNGSTEYRKAIKSRRRGNKINGESTDRTKRQAYLDNNYPATIWKNGVAFMFHESLSKLWLILKKFLETNSPSRQITSAGRHRILLRL